LPPRPAVRNTVLVLAERPLPDDCDMRLARLVHSWAGDSDIAAAYLFGSRARGSASGRSDIDLAVILDGGLDADQRWKKRLDLLSRGTEILGTDALDLVVLEDAPVVLAHRVLRDGRLLFERDPCRRTQIAEDVMRRYVDEEYLRREIYRGLANRLHEGRFAR
jgi:predicted nucleotidyltransferase